MAAERVAPRRCAIYTRKSSEEGLDQEFNSLHAQREACEAYITSQRHEGWKLLPDSYDDGGFSGGSIDRPGLKRLLAAIEAGQIDIVVVYKVDRLTRSLADFAKIVEILDVRGASFVSVTQQFNTTTSMGRLTLNILLSFAQFEREVTGERIRDKVAASKAKGMWMGGCVPLGYDVVDKKLIVNPAEVETIRTIFERYTELGYVSKLQVWLRRNNVHSKSRTSRAGVKRGGTAFSRGALYQLLKNRTYLGQVHHRGKTYPGMHDAIINQDLWDGVQAKLEANRNADSGTRRSRTSSMLTGRIYDGQGVRLTPTHAISNGKRYRYYAAAPASDGSKRGRGRAFRVAAHEIETIVSSQVRRLLEDRSRLLDALKPCMGKSVSQKTVLDHARELVDEWTRPKSNTVRDVVGCVVTRVALDAESVAVTVDPHLLLSQILGKAHADNSKPRDADPSESRELIRLATAVALRTSSRGSRLIVASSDMDDERSHPNPALIKALARAHAWFDQLMSGNAKSIRQISRENGMKFRYIPRVMRLAFLAPDLVEKILSGTQPPELTVEDLIGELPVDWRAQRERLKVQVAQFVPTARLATTRRWRS